MIITPAWVTEGNDESATALLAGSDNPAYLQLLLRYRRDPVAFVREVLGVNGKTPDDPNYLSPYQADILRAFVDEHRVAVRGPHGLGKTALSSWIILWAICVFDGDVKVVTT